MIHLHTLLEFPSALHSGSTESNVGMILAESLPAEFRIMADVDLSLIVRLWSMPWSE